MNAFSPLAWAVSLCVLAYVVFVLLFSRRQARHTQSMADYATGSLLFSPYVVGLSLAASMTSAATFLINPGFVAYYGLSAFLAMGVVLPLGAMLSLVVLTKRFRKVGKAQQAQTLAQWMALRFGSPVYRVFFSGASLLLITFMVLICVGLTKILAGALGTDPLWTLWGIVGVVFGYMMVGGANTMVYTNLVQALLKVGVSLLLFYTGWEYLADGPSGLLSRLQAVDPLLSQPYNPSSPLFRDFFEVVFCQAVVGVAVVCQPHILTRSLMLKQEADVDRYLLSSLLALSLFFLVIGVGFFARLSLPDLQVGGQPLPLDGVTSAYVLRNVPPSLSFLIVVGLLAAGLSALESLIQSLSTTLTTDLLPALAGSRFRPTLATNRWVIALLALITGALASGQLLHPNLSVGLLAQNGVYAFFAAAFVPVLFGIFLPRTPRWVPLASACTALLVHFGLYYSGYFPYLQGPVRNPAVSVAMAILSALAVGLLGYLLRSRQPKQQAADALLS